jgi:nicotinamide mononucleotide transporter
MNDFYINRLEIIASFFSIIAYWFGTKQRLVFWPISIVTSLIGFPIYYYRLLYASFFQNIIYIIMSLYGWYHWRYGGKGRTELTLISTIAPRDGICLGIGVLVYVVTFNPILIYLGSSMTLLDATRNALAMVGMWAASHKKVETYPIWFVADSVSMYLFYKQGSYPFIFKYFVCVCLSVYSFYVWYNQYKRHCPIKK